jgi:hypothetical protein
MTGTASWARVVVAASDGTRRVVLLVGDGAPGLEVVDRLARCQLTTRRAGGRMWLEEVCPALAQLLDLVGLRRELEGQAEGGEEPICVEE